MAGRRSRKRAWNERIARREALRRHGGCVWCSMKNSMNEFAILPGGTRMLLRRSFASKTMQRETRRFLRRAAGDMLRRDAPGE